MDRATITAERPLDIITQFDGKRISLCFGIQPDRRDYRVNTHHLKNASTTFIRCWAFVVVVVRWRAA